MSKQRLRMRQPNRRILIVDDHALVRRGLAGLIGDEPNLEVCGEADNINDALALVRTEEPDVAIVDISLKNENGLELIKRIKAVNRSIKILVSSMHEETLFAERAIHAGASGYIEKGEQDDFIIEAIRVILDGKIYLSAPMRERIIQGSVGREEPSDRSPFERLSDRELVVFQLVGQGLRTSQIAKNLHLSVHTIETHRENVKRKLKLATGSELVRYATQWSLEQK